MQNYIYSIIIKGFGMTRLLHHNLPFYDRSIKTNNKIKFTAMSKDSQINYIPSF